MKQGTFSGQMGTAQFLIFLGIKTAEFRKTQNMKFVANILRNIQKKFQNFWS